MISDLKKVDQCRFLKTNPSKNDFKPALFFCTRNSIYLDTINDVSEMPKNSFEKNLEKSAKLFNNLYSGISLIFFNRFNMLEIEKFHLESIKIVEMNFFKFTFLVTKWEKQSPNSKPAFFEILPRYSNSSFRLSTPLKIETFTLNQMINSGEEKDIFQLLIYHLESLQSLYKLDQAYKYLKTIGLHPITGNSYFLFHQITPICWELQLLPYSDFYKQYDFLNDNFVSIRFRLDLYSGSIFLFQELKTGELIPDFYEMIKNIYKQKIEYAELIMRITEMDQKTFLEFFEYFISFTMTRTNLKLCKTYVSLTSWKTERRSWAFASMIFR